MRNVGIDPKKLSNSKSLRKLRPFPKVPKVLKSHTPELVNSLNGDLIEFLCLKMGLGFRCMTHDF